MSRSTASALAAIALLALGACSDRDSPTRVAAPSAMPSPPATTPTPTTIPPPPATGVDAGTTAKDSASTDPAGTLSKDEEAKSMPMAGHGNNHSSPSLEPATKP